MIHKSQPSTQSLHISRSADFAALDELYRQAKCCYNRAARLLILDLKSMHHENELACEAVNAQVNAALTNAGYHRIDRGPWRKARGSKSVRTPKTEHLTPALVVSIAARRTHIRDLRTRYDSAPTFARSKTAARTYARYFKRAQFRLSAAEGTLQTIRDLAIRKSKRE